MSLLEVNKNPSRSDLAWFGLILFLVLVWIGFLITRATGAPGVLPKIAMAAAALSILYYAVPPIQRPMYVGWMIAMYPIGYVVSHVLLGLLYFGVLTPVAVVLRVFRYDPMQRAFDRKAASYWAKRERGPGRSDYFRQF